MRVPALAMAVVASHQHTTCIGEQHRVVVPTRQGYAGRRHLTRLEAVHLHPDHRKVSLTAVVWSPPPRPNKLNSHEPSSAVRSQVHEQVLLHTRALRCAWLCRAALAAWLSKRECNRECSKLRPTSAKSSLMPHAPYWLLPAAYTAPLARSTAVCCCPQPMARARARLDSSGPLQGGNCIQGHAAGCYAAASLQATVQAHGRMHVAAVQA